MIKIRAGNVVHVVKSCNGFILTFHEPLVKRLQDSQKESELNLGRENLGRDRCRFFHFRTKPTSMHLDLVLIVFRAFGNPQNGQGNLTFGPFYTKHY